MTYTEQLELEKLNLSIMNNIIDNKDNFIEYYYSHTQKETMSMFGIRTYQQLRRILDAIEVDRKDRNTVYVANRGVPAKRSHESYILGGIKSGETQKRNWQNKSDEEKEAWSKKQSLAHLNNTFKEKITATNREYRMSLTDEERKDMDLRRSNTLKQLWQSKSDEEKQEYMRVRFNNGAGYKTANSKPNKLFKADLEMFKIKYSREYRLDNYSYDFKLDDLNILVEIDPTITHNSTLSVFKNKEPLNKDYHMLKSECANKHGFRCIHIFDWDDKYKVLNMLQTKEKIYARNCEVREIDKNLCKDFINKYHLQDYARDSIRVGLFYDNKLVSVMTFSKPRYNKNYEYELIRYCSSKSIIGGSEKLFKYFVDKYNPKSIISYCDKSKFSGDTYIKLGFKLLKDNKPSKHWYNIKTKEHITDNLLRQKGFDKLFNTNYGKGTSNDRLMFEYGFVEVYDCGQSTFVINF